MLHLSRRILLTSIMIFQCQQPQVPETLSIRQLPAGQVLKSTDYHKFFNPIYDQQI